jgi:chromosome segregation protein
MRLKQIKLIGFKSFVDPTVLHLNSQIIGIVGPNGCGKSNIIDAVRWVLGESSAKDLRGESMLDVIFNGSSMRKPIGRAAIELLFDNLEGKLNREYANFSEVAIRREIDRERQSEYFLNNKRCRKRDITDLFAGTGLLHNGYAIVGQGTVGKIIESKPEELRSYIEEAADISIYKKRKHETQLRMNHTEENLSRLQDLVSEQARLLEKLEKQSIVAEKYQNYQADKQQIEIQLLKVKVYQFKQDLALYNQKITEYALQLEQKNTDKTSIIAKLEQQKITYSEQTEEFNNIKEKYYDLSNNIARLEQTLQHKKEQQIKYKENLQLIDEELATITKQYEQDQQLQTTVAAELLAIEGSYTELKNKKDGTENSYLASQANLQDFQHNLQEMQLNLQKLQSNSDKTKLAIEQLEDLSKELCGRVDRLNQEHGSYNQDELLTEILLIEKDLRQQEELHADNHQELENITTVIKQKKLAIKDLAEQKSNLQSDIHKLQGSIGYLESLQRSVLTVNSGKQQWLTKQHIDSELFFDQLTIEDGWEVAVAVVLQQYLDAILLPGKIHDINLNALQTIKEFRLAVIESESVANKHNTTAGLVAISSKIQNNCSIINLLANIYAVEDLAIALQQRNKLLAHECFITKQGELVGHNWLIIDKVDPKQNILARKKELEDLQQTIDNLTTDLTTVNQKIELAEQELAAIEEKQVGILNNNQQQESTIRNMVAELSAKKSHLAGIKSRTEKILTEIKEYQAKITDLSAKEQKLRANLSEQIEEISTLSANEQQLLQQKSGVQENFDSLMAVNKAASKEFHEISLQRQQLITKNQGLTAATERLSNQIKNLQDRQAKLQVEVASNSSPLKPIELELELLLDDKSKQEDKMRAADLSLQDSEDNIKSLEQQQNDLMHEIESVRTELENFKLQQNAVATKIEAIKETVAADQQEIFTADLSVELESEVNIEEWQKKLDSIVKKIDRLGSVNLAAIEEFTLEQERKNYLDLQIEDLTTALNSLQDAIAKIELETRKKFKATFEQINHNLQQLFPKLFGGGGAYLELNTGDWLTSGVSIFAQPPGKKNSSIYLLSGGEKALTATALIFAIFQLNPSPFCILDEVDAPLDDANVIRLGELLVDMSEKIQFLLITHNKATMKIVNQLTGVTMKEPGVSRLVSVNVDEAVAMLD